jgi:flavin reductase (DIM6/NTAB) family NADH-FMN oxidoreductase RutF
MILAGIPYGLYVVGAKSEDGIHSIIANWVGQVSFKPVLLSIAIERNSEMRSYIHMSNLFSLNMLSSGSKHIAKLFLKRSKHTGTTINGQEVVLTKNGVPLIKEAVASLELRVVNSIETGDHTLFVGEVIYWVAHSRADILTLKETGWKYSR